ncbi:MAG TPA: peptidylprolyl isomerase [Thermoanaerobaculia bacterium]|jgi:cyclophilin family peptidyl-prolyl cis-trans isomerase
MRKLIPFALAAAFIALSAVADDAPLVRTYVYLSPTYTIDKKYRSMEGPGSTESIYIDAQQEPPELLWIVGVKTEMVGEDGETPQLPELMCHVNVDLDATKHSAMFNLKRYTQTRLVTLSQGMINAQFPEGFAYPLASNEPLNLFTQVLNHNIEHPNNLKVRHRVTISYIRDKELKSPLKPLFNVGASGTVILDNSSSHPAAMPNMAMAEVTGSDAKPVDHTTSCLILPRAPNAVGTRSDYTDPQGHKVTGHWVVPPGHQVNHSDITWFMGLPMNASLHWAAAHLHPYAQSLTIRDTTTGETIFEVKATGPKDKVGLDKVETFTSEKGVPMFKDHKYELISVYDNPTQQNADSMASAFLALEDPAFVRPDEATLARRAADYLDSSRETAIVVRTNAGDFGLQLLHDLSPNAVRNFVRLARVGAFDHARISHLLPGVRAEVQTAPLSDVQKAAAIPYVAEHRQKVVAAMLTVCSENALTFNIALGPSTEQDEHCTPFASVGPGAEVLRIIGRVPTDRDGTPLANIEIKKIDVYENMNKLQANFAPPKEPSIGN